MLLFSHTLQGYGFSSDKMYILLQELRENYMQKWVVNFRDIFDADNYHPIQVGQNVNTFSKIIKRLYFKLLQIVSFNTMMLIGMKSSDNWTFFDHTVGL